MPSEHVQVQQLSEVNASSSHFDIHYAATDIGHASSFTPHYYESTPALHSYAPVPPRHTRSEVGHGSSPYLPPNMSSATFLPSFERPLSMFVDSRKPPIKQYRNFKDAIASSVSNDPSVHPSSSGDRRPRKLRKNVRADTDDNSTSQSKVLSSASSYFSSATSVPSTTSGMHPSQPRPRKLSKRPTSSVNPQTLQSFSFEPLPQVPPKTVSALKVDPVSDLVLYYYRPLMTFRSYLEICPRMPKVVLDLEGIRLRQKTRPMTV